MLYYLCLLLVLLFLSCDEPQVEIVPATKSWQPISIFSSLDIRYMLKANNNLYVSAVDPSVTETEMIGGKPYYKGDKGLLFSTEDGINWKRIKAFNMAIGPLTFLDDTLLCMTDYTIFALTPASQWIEKYPTPERLQYVEADGDIISYKGYIYSMQTYYGNAMETYRIHPDGSSEEVGGPDGLYHYAGAKYIKTSKDNEEQLYLRPAWYTGGFLKFDGTAYTRIETGLTSKERENSPTNSMVCFRDTIYAGFGGIETPGVIKKLVGGEWEQFLDTLPDHPIAYQVTPVLKTQSTAIVFAKNSIYVATIDMGVLVWDKEKGWQQLSDGLLPGYISGEQHKNLYSPITFLENIRGRLIVGYGKPGYAPWGGVGIYSYPIGE